MNHKAYLLFFLVLYACGQNVIEMKTPKNATKKFEEFIAKKKFVEEFLYPGIAEEKMRPIFTEKTNKVATDFLKVAKSNNPTNIKYLQKIDIGLARFANIYFELDTEDRERVCTYFEELMNIVGLESSNGKLNKFMYGLNPN